MRDILITLRLFAASFLTLLGLGFMAKASDQGQVFVGAILAAIGLTFFVLLWLGRRGQ